jgi:hypothetical protein
LSSATAAGIGAAQSGKQSQSEAVAVNDKPNNVTSVVPTSSVRFMMMRSFAIRLYVAAALSDATCLGVRHDLNAFLRQSFRQAILI